MSAAVEAPLSSPFAKNLFGGIVEINQRRKTEVCDLFAGEVGVSLFLERSWGGIHTAGVTVVTEEQSLMHFIEKKVGERRTTYSIEGSIAEADGITPLAVVGTESLAELYALIRQADLETPVEERSIDPHERAEFWRARLIDNPQVVSDDELMQIGADIVGIRAEQKGLKPNVAGFFDGARLEGDTGNFHLFYDSRVRGRRLAELRAEYDVGIKERNGEAEAFDVISLAKVVQSGDERFNIRRASGMRSSPLTGLPGFEKFTLRPASLDISQRLMLAYSMWDGHLETPAEPRYPIDEFLSAYPHTGNSGPNFP